MTQIEIAAGEWLNSSFLELLGLSSEFSGNENTPLHGIYVIESSVHTDSNGVTWEYSTSDFRSVYVVNRLQGHLRSWSIQLETSMETIGSKLWNFLIISIITRQKFRVKEPKLKAITIVYHKIKDASSTLFLNSFKEFYPEKRKELRRIFMLPGKRTFSTSVIFQHVVSGIRIVWPDTSDLHVLRE
ncbi:MAG: hypothetical protein PHU97_02390 [Bacteroidales bacterium]|nr:hypothetical protein [Bacteroidales bacterium]MDD2323022.1 hypothetical protein [Bacteroidales bacterium]MDD3010149.1 hypothetical protein [Bacteroidales bacterium]MDD3961141.1 hypothetical protein [Bacteroidales bacterium]MDY0287008.1 hypothetical protein [Bacteroidales bacterium]